MSGRGEGKKPPKDPKASTKTPARTTASSTADSPFPYASLISHAGTPQVGVNTPESSKSNVAPPTSSSALFSPERDVAGLNDVNTPKLSNSNVVASVSSPLFSPERSAAGLSLVETVFYDFTILLKLKKNPPNAEDVEATNRYNNRYKKVRNRAFLSLSKRRDTIARKNIMAEVVPTLHQLTREDRWAELRQQSIRELLELYAVSQNTDPAIVVARMIEEVCDGDQMANAARDQAILETTLKQQRADLHSYLTAQVYSTSFATELTGRNEQQLRVLAEQAEQDSCATLDKKTAAAEQVTNSNGAVLDAKQALNEHTLVKQKQANVEQLSTQPLDFSVVDNNGDTVLDKALQLEDRELVDAVWQYAGHLDASGTNFNHRARLARQALSKSPGNRERKLLLDYLTQQGVLFDQNFIKQIQTRSNLFKDADDNADNDTSAAPPFDDLFGTNHQSSEEAADDETPTTPSFDDLFDANHQVLEKFLAVLICHANNKTWPKLVEELKRRYICDDNATQKSFPKIIWDAIQARQKACDQACESFEHSSAYFTDMLAYLARGYKEDPNYYLPRWQATVAALQQASIEHPYKSVEQAQSAVAQLKASELMNPASCWRPRSAGLIKKTERTVNKVARSARIAPTFSSPPAIAPTTAEEMTASLTRVSTALADKAVQQERWVLIQQVLKNTLDYLKRRSRGSDKLELLQPVIDAYVQDGDVNKLISALTRPWPSSEASESSAGPQAPVGNVYTQLTAMQNSWGLWSKTSRMLEHDIAHFNTLRELNVASGIAA